MGDPLYQVAKRSQIAKLDGSGPDECHDKRGEPRGEKKPDSADNQEGHINQEADAEARKSGHSAAEGGALKGITFDPNVRKRLAQLWTRT